MAWAPGVPVKQWKKENNPLGPPADPATATPISTSLTDEYQNAKDYIETRSQDTTPTAVLTGVQNISAGQQLRLDISAGSGSGQLPTAPPNKTRCAIKIVKTSGTPGSTTATLLVGGSDVFNIALGSTVLTFTALMQGATVEYQAADGTWTVQSTDTPLGVALGAAKLGTDGTVGGPSGSGLTPSVVTGSSSGGIPAWVTGTVYAVNVLVSNSGTNYICNTANTAGATFAGDAAKWTALGSAGGPSVVQFDSGTAPAMDHTTVPVDGNVVYFDAASGKLKGEAVLPFPGDIQAGYLLVWSGTALEGLPPIFQPQAILTSQTVVPRAGSTMVEVIAAGGGGGGGGGGSSTSTTAQKGGGGGGGGGSVHTLKSLAGVGSLVVVIGAGGSSGTKGAAGGNNAGGNGGQGGTTTITAKANADGTGATIWTITAYGGSGGFGAAGNSTAQVAGGGLGSIGAGTAYVNATANPGGMPGAGADTNTGAGGAPIGFSGGGGGSGQNASLSNGGTGGSAGGAPSTGQGGNVAGGSGGAPTGAGTDGANGADNSRAGGGGGGGGNNNLAGGAGGVGGSGQVDLRFS